MRLATSAKVFGLRNEFIADLLDEILGFGRNTPGIVVLGDDFKDSFVPAKAKMLNQVFCIFLVMFINPNARGTHFIARIYSGGGETTRRWLSFKSSLASIVLSEAKPFAPSLSHEEGR